MIIAIDGYEANVKNRVGIGRYAYEILVFMYKNFEIPNPKSQISRKINFRIYLPNQPLPDMPKETMWWRYRIAYPKKFWTFFGLPFALLADNPKPDVVFSPTHYIPRFIPYPKVMSIMDLSYISYPKLFKKKDLHQLVHWTSYSVRHADRILTISEKSKNAIIQTYGVDSNRIVVTYPGLTMNKTPSDIRNKYGITGKYILSVGTIQPRKNFKRLIEAFASFYQKKEYIDITLVIIGKKGWMYEEILNAPGKYAISHRVKFLDFIPDNELSTFYQEALCFALPSLYEGFGLPVLEAMANKCLVVVSSTSSLPEIAGNAGIYVDPTSISSIAQGLLEAIKIRLTEEGKKRISEGLEQSKKFTWEKTAKETLRVLTELGESK